MRGAKLDSKTPRYLMTRKLNYLLNSNHCLAELIVVDFHTKLYHISIKQTLTEVRQKFWILKGRNVIRKILRKCIKCQKFNSKSYQYPTTPPITKLRMGDNYWAVINRAHTHAHSPTPTHTQPKKGHTHPHPPTPSKRKVTLTHTQP